MIHSSLSFRKPNVYTLLAMLIGGTVTLAGIPTSAQAGSGFGNGLGTGLGLGIGIGIGKSLMNGSGRSKPTHNRKRRTLRNRGAVGAPGYKATRRGDKGVREIQKSLSTLGYYLADANGQMDNTTRVAISSYQKAKNIVPSGQLDAKQRELLNREASNTELLAHIGNPNVSEAFISNPKKRLQAALKILGHYNGSIDGAFGRGSKNAVARYQNSMGLIPTRILSKDQEAQLITTARANIGQLQVALDNEYVLIAKHQLALLGGNPGATNSFPSAPTTMASIGRPPAPVSKPSSNPNLQLANLPMIDKINSNNDVRREDDVAVIIGNKNYENGIASVSYGDRDADAMKALLINDLGFSEENIIYVKNATSKKMREIFGGETNQRGDLWRFIDPDGASNVFVFYSGHGAPEVNTKTPYLLPIDVHPDHIAANGYPLDLLYRNLNKLPIKSATVLLDACFSGESPKGTLVKSMSPVMISTKTPSSIQSAKLTVLAASAADQVASWDNKTGHGIFTRYALTGLKGAADANGDKNITAGELHAYLMKKVRKSARRSFGRVQIPVLHGNKDLVMTPGL